MFYEKDILKTESDYKKASIGYGRKFDLYEDRRKNDISPGPKYNTVDSTSIGAKSVLERSGDAKMLKKFEQQVCYQG